MVRKVLGVLALAVGVVGLMACAGPVGDELGPATVMVLLPMAALAVGGAHLLGLVS